MSHRSKSESIVNFLANLMPVFTHDYFDDEKTCARSLLDGTLILPLSKSTCPDWDEESLEDRSDEVVVYWQGDLSRKSVVLADQLVHLAIVKYAEVRELHLNGQEAASNLIKHMIAHYEFKTGQIIDPAYYGEDKYSELIKLMNKVIEKLGLDIVLDTIKTVFGRN